MSKALKKHKFLAHAINIKLGTYIYSNQLYKMNDWKKWKDLETIHLLINHRFYSDKESPIKDFDEQNIWTYNRTYGIMVRSILRRANLLLPADGQSLKD